ncbi:alpha/beta hydrolase [Pseudomonas sp. NFX224]|uniref:alpha/beta hydrolase n=1 Tax=Pseudomonas sp. NFX224 TaxID=3402862 RepID=UPI003AFA3B66
MNSLDRLDPELLPLLDAAPTLNLDDTLLTEMRAAIAQRYESLVSGYGPIIHTITSVDGQDIALYHYPAKGPKGRRPAILHMHGGGMVIGSAASSARTLAPLCGRLGISAFSVEYRLAPQARFPLPQEDCYAALRWLVEHADELEIDSDRIVVMGESAGGGLATALAQMVRDRGELPPLAGQVLLYPMLDHRTGRPGDLSSSPTAGTFVWTRHSNQFGWSALRGDYTAGDERRGWFSPSLAENFAELAPAFIAVGDLDLFACEDLTYAQRLMHAGVPVELHLYAGAPHGFDLLESATVSQRLRTDVSTAICRYLALPVATIGQQTAAATME